MTPALLALVLAATMPGAAAAAASHPPLEVAAPSIATDVEPTKIDVMGVWAHPDDDAGFTTPCGVWNDLYDIKCGIIMVTRGEGGSNSVGPEAGPDLGLRRENEDRTSHFRSGTVDIFNLDRVDFFYNTSAPLTAQVWDAEETLRRTVRILRETQPEILFGGGPAPVGHGNHQQAQGRLIWEAASAAADPTRFPEQLTGPFAVDTWQVKKVIGGASNQGTGGTEGPDCTTGFIPNPDNPFTVAGTWTGYPSPYLWPAGNVQGQEAGTPKTWAQVGREGGRAHPTQARVMEKGLWPASCLRWGISQSFVPFQPNSSAAAGMDEALFYGASIPDPGGMPLGSLLYLMTEEYFNAAGEPFDVTVRTRSGAGTLPAGSVELDVPEGWDVSAAQPIGPISAAAEATATFTVTPAADAPVGRYQIAAHLTTGTMTGYTDTRVSVAPPVQGRFQRVGNQAEFEVWALANDVFIAGLAPAIEQIGAGESITVPVVVTNRSAVAQTGEVSLTLPPELSAEAVSLPYTALPAGTETTLTFALTHTDPTAPGGATVPVGITTTFGDPVSSSSEELTLYVVPTTVIPEVTDAPTLDAVDTAGEYGTEIDVSRRWEGQACEPDGTDCGAGSYAKLAWNGDDLYAVIHVVDDTQSAAAPPERCFGHWLVDSVEVLLDPRGSSVDTSTTFKSGIFPFTDDPTNMAGNGVNGPCWTRDADNHQGFSSGPLAATVEDGPNALGMEVVTDAVIDPSGSYVGGAYNVEIKIPLDVLPAGVGPTSTPPTGELATNDVNPLYLGLNVTPYDSDTQDFIGQTRLAWSPFGSQQSEPYRWGHAYLQGYQPPADRPTTSDEPRIPDTALMGVESPQSIYQSATRGVTLSGLQPSSAMTVTDVEITGSSVDLTLESTAPGTARAFVWHGEHGFIPVWTSSCPGDTDGFSACSAEDGAAPPWGPSMGGRLLGQGTADVVVGSTALSVQISDEAHEALAADGSVLVSFQADSGGVNAWAFPVVAGTGVTMMTPERVLAVAQVSPDAVQCWSVAGQNGIPADATGVIANVTTVSPDGPGYAVVFPDTAGNGMTPIPATSTVNFEIGQDVASSTFVRLPENGDLCYATKGAAHVGLLVDVSGYVESGSGIVLGNQVRLLDTRPLGVGQIDGPVRPRTVETVQVAGLAGVPADADSVLLNVTVTGVSSVGNLRVFPGGSAVPNASVVNYAPGYDKANSTVVALSDAGTISFWSDTDRPVQVVLDVLGHTEAGSSYAGVTPTRVVDTRAGMQIGSVAGPMMARTVHSVPMRGGVVPAGATAVVLNVTTIDPTSVGNLRVYPDADGTGSTPPPNASSVNYIAGRDVPNLVVVNLPANGRVNFWSDQDGGTVDLAVDVVGYIALPAP